MLEEKYNIDNYLRTARDKHTYFLLAASASAIAFAITQTKSLGVSWSQIPLALAVLLWGLSFYFGCKCARHTQALHQDSAYIHETEGGMENMPETKEEVMEMLSDSYSNNLSLTQSSDNLQFYFLIFGGVSFIAWHAIEMVLRS
jgi:hypothetical protein